MLRTGVIVVNYGSSSLLARNLTASTTPDDIVVVVDNWSSSKERDAIAALAHDHGWLLEAPDANLGFGSGMNLGAARALAAGATTLLLLNPDAIVSPADGRRLAEQVDADRSLLLAPRIMRSDGAPWMSGTMDLWLADGRVGSTRRRPPGAEAMLWVSGAVMALSSDLWKRIGGFDDDYFLYWEDIDLCRRVHEAGGRVDVDTTVVARHDEGGTHADGGGRAKSETFYYYNIRNRSLYAAKWLGASDRRRWARRTPRTALDVLLTGGRRQFVQSIKPWRAYIRGVFASTRVRPSGPSPSESAS